MHCIVKTLKRYSEKISCLRLGCYILNDMYSRTVEKFVIVSVELIYIC